MVVDYFIVDCFIIVFEVLRKAKGSAYIAEGELKIIDSVRHPWATDSDGVL